MYVAEDPTQNRAKAKSALDADAGSRNSPAKTKGASTKPFFAHCLGRTSFTSPRTCRSGGTACVVSSIKHTLLTSLQARSKHENRANLYNSRRNRHRR